MKDVYLELMAVIVLVFVIGMFSLSMYDNNLCNAIFLAEGGLKATYLYGIVSVKYKDITEAREICLRTIRNQRIRHLKHKCGLEFLECLAKRYCPYDWETWLKNVKSAM